MMSIWEPDKLVLFLIFFVPGFVSLKVWALLAPSERRDFSRSLFEVIGYSALNFAALSWIIILVHSGELRTGAPVWYYVLLVVIMLVAPALWPFLLRALSRSRTVKRLRLDPFLKPWDSVFVERKSYWVILHLTNGKRIGGKFSTRSFASSYPAEEQIYLEELWKLDKQGAFEKAIERSRGIIVSASDLIGIELFDYFGAQENEEDGV